MGYFDGVTANLFRYDASGRRVFAPLGKRGGVYLVPDEAAPRIVTAVRRFYQAMLASVLLVGMASHWGWAVWAVGGVFVVAGPILAWSLTRGLEAASLAWSDLPPISRSEIMQRQSRAVGKPVLYAMLLIALVFTAGGIWMVVIGAPKRWFVLSFSLLMLVSFVSQLRNAR